jgi:phage tail-like protein
MLLRRLCCQLKALVHQMANYPLLSCNFRVEWGGTRIGFLEVVGLSATLEATEYREGDEHVPAPHKVPGLVRYPNVTLRRGMMAGDNDLYQWFSTAQGGAVERRDLVVSLLDAQHAPIVTWMLRQAFPVRVSYGPLDATRGKVLIEEVEVAYEGLVVKAL